MEADQLLEGAALLELRVVEAADHDVADVLEAVGAQKVAMPVASHEMISGNGRQCGRSGRHASELAGRALGSVLMPGEDERWLGVWDRVTSSISRWAIGVVVIAAIAAAAS